MATRTNAHRVNFDMSDEEVERLFERIVALGYAILARLESDLLDERSRMLRFKFGFL